MEFPLKTAREITECILNYTKKGYSNCMSTDAYSFSNFRERIALPFTNCLEDICSDSRYIYTKEYYPYHNTDDIIINKIQDGAYYFLGCAYIAKHLISIEHHLDAFGHTNKLKGFTKIANGVVVFYNNIPRDICKEVIVSILKTKDYIIDEWRAAVNSNSSWITQVKKEFGDVVDKIFDNKRIECFKYILDKVEAPNNMSFIELEPYFNDFYLFVKDLAMFSVERSIFHCNNRVIRRVNIMDDKYWYGHPTNTSSIIYRISEYIKNTYNKIKYFIKIM